MTQIDRTRGIPVLAYPKCDASSPVSLSLFFRCNERRAQVTLVLQSSLRLQGFDDAQTFLLQYDADNLVPGVNSLGPAIIPLPQKRLDEIARQGNPQVRTLSLTVKRQCPIWCRPFSEPLEPQPGFETCFDRFAELAQAADLHLVFDYNRLHRHYNIFERLLKHPEEFSGFPVSRYYAGKYHSVDASIFNAAKRLNSNTGGLSDATTEDEEAPPAYAERSKRPRETSTPTPRSPPLKRVLLSPYSGRMPSSPTEKDSVATPTYPLADFEPSLVATQGLNLGPPKSSPADLHDAVEHAVSKLLPSMIEALLPSLIPRLVAAPSSTSSSQQPVESQTSQTPSPPKLSTFGIALSEDVTERIEGELKSIYAHTLSHANYLRNAADVELFDAVTALERAADSKLEEFKAECEGVVEDVRERVAQKEYEVCDNVKGALDVLRGEQMISLERERDILRRERGWLSWEKDVLKKDRKRFEEEQKKVLPSNTGVDDDRSCRAGSAPL